MKIVCKQKGIINAGSIIIALGILTLFAGNGSSFSMADNFFFFLVAIVINIVRMFLEKKLYIKNEVIVYSLMILCVLTVLLGVASKYTDAGTFKTLIMFYVFVLSILMTKFTEKDIDCIEGSIIGSALIFSILVLFFGNHYLSAYTGKYTYIQNFGNRVVFEPNYLAFWISLGFELAVIKAIKMLQNKNNKRTMILLLFAVIQMIAMFRTGSRLALVAALIFCLSLVLFINNKKIKKRLMFACVLLLIGGVLAIHFKWLPDSIVERLFVSSYFDNSNIKRLADWGYGLQLMLDRIFGLGPVVTSEVLELFYGFRGDAHNTFITMGIYYGLFGFILFALLWGYVAFRLLKSKEYTYFALLVSFFFQANVLAAQCTLTLWLFLLILFMKVVIKSSVVQ